MSISARHLISFLSVAVVAIATATTALATVPYLAKDINPSHWQDSSWPQRFVELDGDAYFTANDGVHGYELWRTDGTAAGTVLVKDVVPSPVPSSRGRSRPLGLREAGGKLFVSGNGLWSSDGTTGGTVHLDSLAGLPVELDGGVSMLVGNDGIHGWELWRTDGTVAGTYMVVDINPGSEDSHPTKMLAVAGTLFFQARGPDGIGLWKSDGTEAGTLLVKNGLEPGELADLNGTLLFSASDELHGEELWKSDGTEAGTVVVRDIVPGTESSQPRELTAVNGSLFFVARDDAHGGELWKTDGSSAGTVLVADVVSGEAGSWPRSLTPVGDVLFFSAHRDDAGYELWMSDGTAEGTVLVQDIRPGSSSSEMRDLTAHDGALYFSAKDGIHGRELWTSDGTAAGTFMVRDIFPDAGSGGALHLASAGGALYFTADDGSGDWELWTSDGSTSGTRLLADLNPGHSDSIYYDLFTDVDGTLFFRPNDGVHGTEIWTSDGTEAGTNIVKDIALGPGTPFPVSFLGQDPITVQEASGGLLFFTAGSAASGSGLWRSDGTEAGTFLLRQQLLYPPALGSDRPFMEDVGGTLFYQGSDPSTGIEPWRSDGTVAGTALFKELVPPSEGFDPRCLCNEEGNEDEKGRPCFFVIPGDSRPSHFTNVDGTLFFTATDGVHGRELWMSDGTEEGTVLVKDIYPPQPGDTSPDPGPGNEECDKAEPTYPVRHSDPSSLTNVGGTLFFVAEDGVAGRELWRSDGTGAGTHLVKDIRIGPDDLLEPGSNAWREPSAAVGDVLFFVANDGVTGNELWISDGTGPGTYLVKDIQPGLSPSGAALGSSPSELTALGKTLYFVATTPDEGTELWTSDGTPEGTFMVRDIVPGPMSSSPGSLLAVDGRLLFSAVHPEHGIELFWSDGTEEGTEMFHDIVPGPGNSLPHYLTVSGDHVYFAATGNAPGDGSNVELWAFARNRPPVAVCKDVTVAADAQCLAEASVDAGSFDPEGGPLAMERSLTGPYGLGTHAVTLTIRDGWGASDSCTATVTVEDRTAPELSVSLSPTSLWPPNHRMVEVTAAWTANDNCDEPAVTLASVTCNEPDDAPGAGDGKTVGDIAEAEIGTGDESMMLRAERDGAGNGRVYTVVYRAADASGNEITVDSYVYVPHDQGDGAGSHEEAAEVPGAGSTEAEAPPGA